MYRSNHCGALRIENSGQQVVLSGWVHKVRDKGGIVWVDLRDRYGVTQIVLEEGVESENQLQIAKKLGREFVIQVRGKVVERHSKNPNLSTGEIEVRASEIKVLNQAKVPPFTIEDDTDGGEELRMTYRYLDIRRNPIKENLLLRNKLSIEIRKYLDAQSFVEVETPYLIKSTPEGARDFLVPSRMNQGEFYALPQSPQTFKQLLMVAGMDRYYQVVKCFRDEDLRADRQPEFTQIDCEMAFVEQEDVLQTFEGLTKHLFKAVKGIELGTEFPRMTFDQAIRDYGIDKPDLRFDMKFNYLNEQLQGKDFQVFNQAEVIVGLCASGAASFSRKQLDALTDFVKRPQIGASGLVYIKYAEDGSIKSSVDKFYQEEDLQAVLNHCGAKAGDLVLILAGDTIKTVKASSELRLHLGKELGLIKPGAFSPLWVIDFPLLEWDEEAKRFHAMHHPFTSPKVEDIDKMESDPGAVRANAYDLVINGVELGGGSVRIFDKGLQKRMFDLLGFTEEEAQSQFGFLMNAFEYGAPPHAGIAFGFDRLCAVISGKESIRDFIAFPKNNAGRDVMIDSPSPIDHLQLEELGLNLKA